MVTYPLVEFEKSTNLKILEFPKSEGIVLGSLKVWFIIRLGHPISS